MVILELLFCRQLLLPLSEPPNTGKRASPQTGSLASINSGSISITEPARTEGSCAGRVLLRSTCRQARDVTRDPAVDNICAAEEDATQAEASQHITRLRPPNLPARPAVLISRQQLTELILIPALTISRWRLLSETGREVPRVMDPGSLVLLPNVVDGSCDMTRQLCVATCR
jgi:hypothetical protein